jgi:hypothetical protein
MFHIEDGKKLHKMKNGESIALKDMSNKHLINTIKLYQRKAKKGLSVSYGGYCPMYYDEDVIYGNEALQILDYDEYLKELNSRNSVTSIGG